MCELIGDSIDLNEWTPVVNSSHPVHPKLLPHLLVPLKYP